MPDEGFRLIGASEFLGRQCQSTPLLPVDRVKRARTGIIGVELIEAARELRSRR